MAVETYPPPLPLPRMLDRAMMILAVAPVVKILKASITPGGYEWLESNGPDVLSNLADAEAELGRACDSADHDLFAAALQRCSAVYYKASQVSKKRKQRVTHGERSPESADRSECVSC
jgi:hypothetical protein